MTTPLDWYPRPEPVDTGLGLHDSHLTGDNPPDIAQHARNLRAAGITWYKILAGGTAKVRRAKIYLDHGIMPIVRMYVSNPEPGYIPDAKEYVNVGARYIEYSNEPNIGDAEWDGTIPSWSDFGPIVGDHWIRASDALKAQGAIPVFPAMTPGGVLWHRRAFVDTLRHVASRGRLDTFDTAVIGIHPRPLNNPPDIPATEANSTTWNEHRWYIEAATDVLGWTPPFLATEHGYSPTDSQNAEFPPMTEETWARYNRELFERMNPEHPKSVDEHILALCYWLEKTSGLWIADTPFKRGEWIDSGPRPDDRLWGKELWQIQPDWNRNDVRSTPELTPKPAPESMDRELIDVPDWITFEWYDAQPGETYWKLIRFEFRDSDESDGKTNFFSVEPHDSNVYLTWNNQNGDGPWSAPHDKSERDPGANFAKWRGNVYDIWIEDGDGHASDLIHGPQLPYNQHVTEYAWWKLVTRSRVDKFDQLLQREFGDSFFDLRDTLPTHGKLAYDTRKLDDITTYVIHHTGPPTTRATTWETVARYHVSSDPTRNKQPYPGIAYHIGVRLYAGTVTVALLNDIETISYHVGDHNPYSIGIAVMGDFSSVEPQWVEIDVLRRIVGVLDTYLGRTPGLRGHGELMDRVCPGKLQSHVRSLRGSFADELRMWASENQVLRLNPDAALQKAIFVDGYVPTSEEGRITIDGARYAVQRGEHLDSGDVRVYFAPEIDYSSVSWITVEEI